MANGDFDYSKVRGNYGPGPKSGASHLTSVDFTSPMKEAINIHNKKIQEESLKTKIETQMVGSLSNIVSSISKGVSASNKLFRESDKVKNILTLKDGDTNIFQIADKGWFGAEFKKDQIEFSPEFLSQFKGDPGALTQFLSSSEGEQYSKLVQSNPDMFSRPDFFHRQEWKTYMDTGEFEEYKGFGTGKGRLSQIGEGGDEFMGKFGTGEGWLSQIGKGGDQFMGKFGTGEGRMAEVFKSVKKDAIAQREPGPSLQWGEPYESEHTKEFRGQFPPLKHQGTEALSEAELIHDENRKARFGFGQGWFKDEERAWNRPSTSPRDAYKNVGPGGGPHKTPGPKDPFTDVFLKDPLDF